MILYGIPNCDQVKKTKKWLNTNQIPYTFHDVRTQGITLEKIQQWAQQVTWKKLLNQRGTTWRQLPEEQKQQINEQTACKLMQQNPTLIKRPVIETPNTVLVGYDENAYQKLNP